MKTKKKLSRNARIWIYFIICALITTAILIFTLTEHLMLATILALIMGMAIMLILQTIINE